MSRPDKNSLICSGANDKRWWIPPPSKRRRRSHICACAARNQQKNKKFRDEVIIFLSLFVADNGWRTPREWLKPLNHLIDLWGGGGWIHHVFFWLLGNENNGTRHPIQLFISLVQVPTEISSKSPNTSETKVTTKRHGKAFYTWASPLDESH